MFMDSGTSPPSTDLLKCCSCSCSCTLINGGSVTWQRSVKRKFDEFQEDFPNPIAGLDQSSFARVEIENECAALRETVSSQQQTIQELFTELEEERNASSSAANEAMSMILRVQREKAEIQMEARQFKRFAEERMAHDQQELLGWEDLLYKRDQAIQALTCEVHAYKHRMLSFGLTEAEVEGKKSAQSRNPNLVDNVESQFEFPPYDYPPLRCNMNETQGYPDIEDDVDLEKYAFGETTRSFHHSPRHREQLQNLGYRMYQMERNPSSNHLDGEFSGLRNTSEKGVIGQSPRRPGHARKFSTDSLGSFYGTVKETAQDYRMESPKTAPSFKKMNYFTYAEESNLKKVDNASDLVDDTSDRVYTIDSVHNGVSYNNSADHKPTIGINEDIVNTPGDTLFRADIDDPDIKKLYRRLQTLEADRESMKQEIILMRTDKAQLVLLREIAQHLYKEMTPERRIPPPVKRPSLIWSFSLMSALKWIVSFVLWRKKACRSKYMIGLSTENVGLLMILDKGPRNRPWRCLTSVQSRK
ncbi:hypothetical protein NE237_004129 [Protea cynaroides]|uniref:GTD-binding domain-containing protein n=1 Tax=Protea cynaroides TaxID=273540 RepID=A0A9Q0KID3_9MAGN|nr:hypothetical protein NE237_004129 [Protea cynaroides]